MGEETAPRALKLLVPANLAQTPCDRCIAAGHTRLAIPSYSLNSHHKILFLWR